MRKTGMLLSLPLVAAAVMLGHAQVDAPKNRAGAEFPCTYNKPVTPSMTAGSLETINGVIFAKDFRVQSGSMILRAESATCEPTGECTLTGTVSVNLAASKPPEK